MLTDAKVAAIKPPAVGREEHKDSGPGYVQGLRLRVGPSGKAWIIRVRAGVKVINKKLGNYPAMKLAAARKAASKLLEALEATGGTEALDRTFGAVAAHWLEHKAREKNRTWKGQGRQLDLHVYPHWRDRKIRDIRRGDVNDLIGDLEGSALPNRVLALIKTIFAYALGKGWIDAHPAAGIERPKKERRRERVLNMGEVARIWRAAELLGYPNGSFVRMLLLTAQRRGEVAAMRWEEVDMEAGTWLLPASATKAERAHLVPLSAPALAVLESVPRIGEYVFTTGTGPISGFAKAKTRLDRYLAAGGPPLVPWRLHDLRRTVATEMGRLGVSVEIIGRVLNHAPQGVTREHYALFDYAPEKRSALDRWAAELMRAVDGSSVDKVVSLRRGK